RVRARTGDHGHPSFRLVDAHLDDPMMLGMAERRAFAGRAHGNETVRALLDLPGDETPKGRLIERAVLEWRDQGSERSPELCLGCHGLPPNASETAPAKN